jgi:hypothetical protein
MHILTKDDSGTFCCILTCKYSSNTYAMSAHAKFIEEYGSDYGYDGKIDAIRKEEFGRVEGILK